MPLIEPLADYTSNEILELAKFFNETLGFTPNSVLTMQRRPAIARAFIELNKAVMDPRFGVNSQLKRMIGYIASLTAGCRYCQAHTILAAQRYGAEDNKLDAIWEYQSNPLFTEPERAALDFALAAASVPNAVTKEIEKNLKRYWSDDQIVEILGVISLFGFLNRWNDSMATPLEEGAAQAAERYLSKNGWSKGKHG